MSKFSSMSCFVLPDDIIQNQAGACKEYSHQWAKLAWYYIACHQSKCRASGYDTHLYPEIAFSKIGIHALFYQRQPFFCFRSNEEINNAKHS
jgi:hypothetical protein